MPSLAAPARQAAATVVRHVDLVHFSHTDYGFTDHPVVCRELQRRYLDIAIDAVLATQEKPEAGKFCWTAETTVAVNDWCQLLPGQGAVNSLAHDIPGAAGLFVHYAITILDKGQLLTVEVGIEHAGSAYIVTHENDRGIQGAGSSS